MCSQNLMKFHHCLFKLLEKNQYVPEKELQRAITLKELAPSPYFSIINVHLWISMCVPNFVKFRHCLFKILKNQNVVDGRTDGHENSIPHKNTVCEGIMKVLSSEQHFLYYKFIGKTFVTQGEANSSIWPEIL